MMRSIVIGVAATLLFALASTDAVARHSGGGHFNGIGIHTMSGGHFGGFRGGHFRHHGRVFVGIGSFDYDYSCWRWQPSPIGWRRVWVCGYPYYPYY